MRGRFALVAVIGVAVACSDLKHADEEPGSGNPDAGNGGDVGPGGDGDGGADPASADAAPDVGQPPVDFECAEPWTKEPKTKAECAPRQVKEIDEGAPSIEDISIARTPAGRVAVAFHAPESPDDGAMRFLYFTPTTSAYSPKLITRPGSFAFQAGYHVKLGASAPDTVHILSHDVDQQISGDLVYFRLVNGQEPLTDPEVVLSALQQRSEIALGVDTSTGNVFATARVTTGMTAGFEIAKLVARQKQVGAAFTAMPDLVTGLSPEHAPGVGSASLRFDGAGKPNVLFHYCDSQSGSQPRYHVHDGSLWSPKKTVDNATLDGFSGFNPRLAVSGNRKIAVFFYRKGLQSGAATADLRVATWSLVGDTPTTEIVEQGIPSDTLANPRYRVAMAVDVYGLIHLAVVSPSSPTKATLDYVRQTRVDGGGTKWLLDIIDDDVIGSDQDAVVDLVVDEKARPHIAYRSGKDLKVRYVTRYDR